MTRIGVRELRATLSDVLDRVRAGEEIVVTERGVPVAKIVRTSGLTGLDRLIAEGLARPPLEPKRPIDRRGMVRAKGSIADLVAEQRR